MLPYCFLIQILSGETRCGLESRSLGDDDAPTSRVRIKMAKRRKYLRQSDFQFRYDLQHNTTRVLRFSIFFVDAGKSSSRFYFHPALLYYRCLVKTVLYDQSRRMSPQSSSSAISLYATTFSPFRNPLSTYAVIKVRKLAII